MWVNKFISQPTVIVLKFNIGVTTHKKIPIIFRLITTWTKR